MSKMKKLLNYLNLLSINFYTSFLLNRRFRSICRLSLFFIFLQVIGMFIPTVLADELVDHLEEKKDETFWNKWKGPIIAITFTVILGVIAHIIRDYTALPDPSHTSTPISPIPPTTIYHGVPPSTPNSEASYYAPINPYNTVDPVQLYTWKGENGGVYMIIYI